MQLKRKPDQREKRDNEAAMLHSDSLLKRSIFKTTLVAATLLPFIEIASAFDTWVVQGRTSGHSINGFQSNDINNGPSLELLIQSTLKKGAMNKREGTEPFNGDPCKIAGRTLLVRSVRPPAINPSVHLAEDLFPNYTWDLRGQITKDGSAMSKRTNQDIEIDVRLKPTRTSQRNAPAHSVTMEVIGYENKKTGSYVRCFNNQQSEPFDLSYTLFQPDGLDEEAAKGRYSDGRSGQGQTTR